MSKLLRYYGPGQIYFITAVTHERLHILSEQAELLLNSIGKIEHALDFQIFAWVIMPDHVHFIIDPKNEDLSNIIKRIKLSFSYAYRQQAQLYRGRVWQHRFWDHVIRNERDLNTHIDYIHRNPVKHGLTQNPFAWQFSSIHQYLENGYYSSDWGIINDEEKEGDFGE